MENVDVASGGDISLDNVALQFVTDLLGQLAPDCRRAFLDGLQAGVMLDDSIKALTMAVIDQYKEQEGI